MTTNRDVQVLQPGNQIILYEVDASAVTDLPADEFRFHGHVNSGDIVFGGKTYKAYPVEAEGFAKSSSGALPTPTLRVANINGQISQYCNKYQDLIGAKVTRLRTFSHYLDGQPGIDPDNPVHMTPEIWIIEAKVKEDQETIDFELRAAIDFNNKQLPARQIVSGVCQWLSIPDSNNRTYRGQYCNYNGRPCDINGNFITDMSLDACSGLLQHCKKRFQEGGYPEPQPMNFGGFPAADAYRGY